MVIHVVKKGDNFYSIGEEYGVDYKSIAIENEIPLDTPLIVGQTIVITQADPQPKQGVIEVNGFVYPYISDEILNKSIKYLTYMSIFSYNVSQDGSLNNIDEEHLIEKCVENQILPVMVITNIDESGGFSPAITHQIFTDETSKQNLFDSTLNVMKQKGYRGLNVDFEYISPDDKDLYSEFLGEITTLMSQNGYAVTVSLVPKTSANQPGSLYEAHDYNAIGNTESNVAIMTYEWGYSYSEPMAVAPIPNVKKVLDYAVSEMPSENILMGMPNYGYDWTLPYDENVAAKAIGNYEAVDIARKYKAEIKYDPVAQAPYFDYYDENKHQHIVWFEDARSIMEKLELPFDYDLLGVSYWTLNRIFPQNWLVLNSLFDIGKL